jgi:dipeptidyl aminopeptidase/acylaminoacyl peptidase
VTRSNPALAGKTFGAVETVRWRSLDGAEIEGLLLKPVGYRPGQRVPLLTYAHGGPPGAFGLGFAPQFYLTMGAWPSAGEPYPVQALAARGFAVFMPNVRGSGSYGERFRRAVAGDLGGVDHADLMSGVDHLIERGIADPDRLGLMGGSYGGFLTWSTLTKTERFRAASAGSGVTDPFGMTRAPTVAPITWLYYAQPPWEDLEAYRETFPVFRAGRIRTPTLIQHGAADPVVPLAQSEVMFTALRRAGVPVEMYAYPDQGHVVTQPKLQVDLMNRNVAWFSRWLRPPARRQAKGGAR